MGIGGMATCIEDGKSFCTVSSFAVSSFTCFHKTRFIVGFSNPVERQNDSDFKDTIMDIFNNKL